VGRQSATTADGAASATSTPAPAKKGAAMISGFMPRNVMLMSGKRDQPEGKTPRAAAKVAGKLDVEQVSKLLAEERQKLQFFIIEAKERFMNQELEAAESTATHPRLEGYAQFEPGQEAGNGGLLQCLRLR